MVTMMASKKLVVFFRLREFFSAQLLQLYKDLIHPCIGAALTSLWERGKWATPIPPIFWTVSEPILCVYYHIFFPMCTTTLRS